MRLVRLANLAYDLRQNPPVQVLQSARPLLAPRERVALALGPCRMVCGVATLHPRPLGRSA
jgi:hypothetical protein